MTTTATRPETSTAAPMARPAPRWAVRAAHIVPILTLPSGLWRVALVSGVPLGYSETELGGAPFSVGFTVYVLSLSLFAEGLALLTLGLVQRWGEVAPRWIPLIGGRRVRPLAAVIPAFAGATILTVLWTTACIVQPLTGRMDTESMSTAGWTLLFACYGPLVGWGPLLFAVTWSYWLRHRRPARLAVAA